MKRIILIFLALFCLTPAFSQAGIIGPANIRFLEGDVMFRTPDDDEWLAAAINTPLDEGDAIWCSEGSRVEIQLPNGTLVRLDEGSQLDLLANEDGFTHLHLASGRLYLKSSSTSGSNSLQIDADNTTVLPDARTRLRIDMLPNDQEDVAIFKGTAYVEGNGSRTKVRAGEHIAMEEGHSELLPLNPSDNWDFWNVERDRAQARSVRADSYLPEELRSHAAELDTNGSWVRVPEYGMVWQPQVIVSDDWAPYRSGRWIWKDDDYVWISSESWGWVPYHYGRWAVVSGFGWCWVPPARGDVFWGPGYVGWYSTDDRVAWTPLAPGETYYAPRYYGPHSKVITKELLKIQPDYRNRNHHGGLTVIKHEDFRRGRAVIQQPDRTPSFSLSVSIGGPRIKPLREMRMPAIKQTPPRVAPPRIEHRDYKVFRDRFPRVVPQSVLERRRQQPPAVVTPAPAVPPRQPPAAREKRLVHPVVTPNEARPEQGTRLNDKPSGRNENRNRPPTPQPAIKPEPTTSGPAPQQVEQPRRGKSPENVPDNQPKPERAKQNEVRQPPATPQPVPQRDPASYGTPSEKKDLPGRGIAPPPVAPTQTQPATPRREENRQRTTVPQSTPPQTPGVSGAAPQRTEPPRKTTAPQPVPGEPGPQRGAHAPGEVKEKKVWKVTTPENAAENDGRDKGRKEKERGR
jgi:hypothetical protein